MYPVNWHADVAVLGMQAKILYEERKKIEATARAGGNTEIKSTFYMIS